jgi:hypothetical protein
MEHINRKIYLALGGALIMAIIAASTYLAFSKPKPPAPSKLMPLKEFSIAATQSGPACVHTISGEILWSCVGKDCTLAETETCNSRGKSFAEFVDNEATITSESTSSTFEQIGTVAGIEDISCSGTSTASIGQLGCLSGQKISVVGPARVFSGSMNSPKQGEIFSKTASSSVADASRYFDVNKNEKVRIGIGVRNNGKSVVNDSYSYSVFKVEQAPKGSVVGANSPICDTQLTKLEAQNDITLTNKVTKSNNRYTLKPSETKLLTAEWASTKSDCGLYQVNISAETFNDETIKTCPSTKPNSNIITSAFIRVAGDCDFPQCNRIELIRQNENSLKSQSVNPGEDIKVRMYLNKSPKEQNLTNSVVAELNHSTNVVYEGFQREGSLNCSSKGTKVTCTLANTEPVKFIELNFKVSEDIKSGEEVSLSMLVLYNGKTTGGSCTKTLKVQSNTLSCEYKPMSTWIEQSRRYDGKGNYFDNNSPARLRTFTIPQSSTKKQVKVRYELAPIGDKTIMSSNGACGPQSNEEAEIYVVGENLMNRTFFGGYRFKDNSYGDTILNKVTNPTPLKPLVHEQTLELAPGSYSIISKWQGDGEDFWDTDIANAKYLVDAKNESKGQVTYDDAIKNPERYGPLCNWAGSYRVRASYCIVDEGQNHAQQLERAVVTIKNNDITNGDFVASIAVNGISLIQQNSNPSIKVEPGKTETFEFVYQNPFPQTSVLEISEHPSSKAKGTLVGALVVKVTTNSTLLDFREQTELNQNALRLKFPQ